MMIGKKPHERLLTRKTRRGKTQPIVDHRDAWARITAEAGVPDLIMHDMRRSAAKRQTRLGVPESSIMKAGGWKTRAMFDRYRIQSLSDQEITAQKLNEDDLRRKQKANSHPSATPDASPAAEEKVVIQ